MARHAFARPNSSILIGDLPSVCYALESGDELQIRTGFSPNSMKESVKFPVARGARYGDAGFWLHGTPARTLSEVLSYLDGDAHDVSKVQWFNGKHSMI